MPFVPPDWMPTGLSDDDPDPQPTRVPERSRSAPVPAATPKPAGLHRARVRDSSSDDFAYPEQQAGIVDPKKTLTGVAFSGGGNRAMVAAWGQLRGLVESGMIEDVDYISCVSGGSWASTAFTYYTDGADNDEEFLGVTTPPDRLRLGALRQISPVSLGSAATESFMSRLIEQAMNVPFGRIPPNDVWIHAVGATFFDRFGLYNRRRPSFITYDDQTVADIVARNPELADARFATIRSRSGSPAATP